MGQRMKRGTSTGKPTKDEAARMDAIKHGEEWRSVVGSPNYEVSNLGRIRSLDRVIPYVDGRNKPMIGRIRKLVVTAGSGYLHAYLSGRMTYAHRAVAQAFVDGYAPGLIVNHIDGDKTNNNASNLEWVTPRENNIHARDVLKISYTPSPRGAANPRSRAVIGVHVATGEWVIYGGLMEAERAGFFAAAICRCCKGGQAVHKGYWWRYANGTE